MGGEREFYMYCPHHILLYNSDRVYTASGIYICMHHIYDSAVAAVSYINIDRYYVIYIYIYIYL
jgi:hypothetical protein